MPDLDEIFWTLKKQLDVPELALDATGAATCRVGSDLLQFRASPSARFVFVSWLLGRPSEDDCAELLYMLLRANAARPDRYSPYFGYAVPQELLLLNIAVPMEECARDLHTSIMATMAHLPALRSDLAKHLLPG